MTYKQFCDLEAMQVFVKSCNYLNSKMELFIRASEMYSVPLLILLGVATIENAKRPSLFRKLELVVFHLFRRLGVKRAMTLGPMQMRFEGERINRTVLIPNQIFLAAGFLKRLCDAAKKNGYGQNDIVKIGQKYNGSKIYGDVLNLLVRKYLLRFSASENN